MRFKARTGGLRNGLEPILAAAVESVSKDAKRGNQVTIVAAKNGISALADGGHHQAINEITDITYDGLDYSNDSEGTISVNAKSLAFTLDSFDNDDIIVAETSDITNDDGDTVGQNLNIFLEADKSENQILAATEKDIDQFPIDLDGQVKIRRDIFVETAQRITYAHGFETSKPEYFYWVLRIGKDNLRFAAGTGGIFAIVDYEGKGLADTNKKKNMLFPAHQTKAISAAFGMMSSAEIAISSDDNNIYLVCDSLTMKIQGIDSKIQWVNEDKFLKRDSSCIVTTKVESWHKAVKGIGATLSDEIKGKNDVHCASMDVDPGIDFIKTTSSNSSGSSKRKVAIEDIKSSEKVEFTCASHYISQIIKEGSKEDFIQMEFDGSMNPAVCRFYANSSVSDASKCFKTNDTLGLTERYSIFFASYNVPS